MKVLRCFQIAQISLTEVQSAVQHDDWFAFLELPARGYQQEQDALSQDTQDEILEKYFIWHVCSFYAVFPHFGRNWLFVNSSLLYLLATRKMLQLNTQLLTSTYFIIIEPEELSAIEAPEAGHNIRPTIKTVIKQAKSWEAENPLDTDSCNTKMPLNIG